MSTVTPSTSNIERSTHFLSKNAQAKNQASNPIANAFAALLMSAEEVEIPVSPDASPHLADDGRDSTGTNQGDNTNSPSDIGQAALAGLLNWQALAAADNSAQGATGNTAPSAGAATNLNTNLPLAQIDLSKPGKLPADPLMGNALGSSASALAQGIAPASLQASIPVSVALKPEQTTSAANESVPSIDLSGMVPTEASAAAVPASPVALVASQATMETLASGADRAGFAKTRTGTSRNQLSTGTATTKVVGAGTALQSNAPNGKTNETDMQPRATVDLVARPAQEVASGTAEVNAPSSDSAPFEQNGPRLTAETGAPDAEHMQAGDHTPIASPPTDPTPLTGMDQSEMADIMDNLSGQIAYWAAQGSQRASLTVGDDKNNPLDVNISMRDGEVHVAFEAAEAEIRDALTLSAEDLLKNMLESKGMTLGDVTVGQRQPSAGHGETTPDNSQGSAQAISQRAASSIQRSSSTGTVDPSAQPHRGPAIATATKLDLFA